MIGAQYYEPIYYTIVSIATFVSLLNVRRTSVKESNIYTLLLCCFLVFFIGLRPVSLKYFVDMYGTAMHFSLWAQDHIGFSFEVENLIYDNIRINMATLGFTYTPFFFLIATIYFGGLYYICTRMFQTRKLLVFLVCLAAFSTFSFATNGVKAGSAASVFLIAMALQHDGKRLPALIVAILSIGFHHSMVLPVFAFVVCLFVRKDNVFFYIWVACFLLALLHITYFQDLFAAMTTDAGNEHAAEYLTGVGQATKGFRIDFILYSAVPIIFGRWLSFKNVNKSEQYQFILNVYTLINSIWMLCMYAEFTNRIAYLSWFMYPIVLIYPFINEDYLSHKTGLMKIFVCGQLFFTLFMEIIYY